jgi:hypothetical protein
MGGAHSQNVRHVCPYHGTLPYTYKQFKNFLVHLEGIIIRYVNIPPGKEFSNKDGGPTF